MGKHKADYSRHMLSGDFVIVVNAAKVEVTGNPSALKTYYRHTGYVGNLKARPMRKALDERPDWVIERAVKGMLPGNRLGRKMFRRLKVYSGETHPHEAQVNAGKGKALAAQILAGVSSQVQAEAAEESRAASPASVIAEVTQEAPPQPEAAEPIEADAPALVAAEKAPPRSRGRPAGTSGVQAKDTAGAAGTRRPRRSSTKADAEKAKVAAEDQADAGQAPIEQFTEPDLQIAEEDGKE
jgi:ribosomal protein L13